MKLLIVLTFLLVFPSYGFELTPDSKKSHCLAFGGKWKGKCIDRLEFQQSAISEGFKSYGKQWCEAKGGKLKRKSRGTKCKGQKADQGITRFENPDLDKYMVHQDIIRVCIDSGLISKNSCKVSATNEKSKVNYTENSSPAMGMVLGFVDEITRIANKIIYNYKGDKEEKILISELKDYMKSGMNSCQKACIVKCAASQVLKYSDNEETKNRGVADIYDKRLGECTEFTSVANTLGRKLGVDVKTMSGERHAYNAFKIEGLWYYGEPQLKSCNFYHTTQTLDLYQSVKSLTPEQLTSNREIGKDIAVFYGSRRNRKIFTDTLVE